MPPTIPIAAPARAPKVSPGLLPTLPLLAPLLLLQLGSEAAGVPQNDTDCADLESVGGVGCWLRDLDRYSGAEEDFNQSQLVEDCMRPDIHEGCDNYMWQACPRLCGRCVDAATDPFVCSPYGTNMSATGETRLGSQDRGGDFEEYHNDPSRIVFISVLMLIVSTASIMATCCLILQVVSWHSSCKRRQQILMAARRGDRIKPEKEICSLICMGPASVYVWEGCSLNLILSYLFFPFFSVCCWVPGKLPKENGEPVCLVFTVNHSESGMVGAAFSVRSSKSTRSAWPPRADRSGHDAFKPTKSEPPPRAAAGP